MRRGAITTYDNTPWKQTPILMRRSSLSARKAYRRAILTGKLTMHGKTNKEVFDVQGKVVGKTITGTATSTIYMTDFGIQPPNLANIAIAQNKVLITLTFTAKEA